MKETDAISVLVCVHSKDHGHDMMLQRALESLAKQTYIDFETVIVMDECWEETQQIISSYEQVLNLTVFSRPRKEGLAAAKNFGIKRCTGDWIAYLDADDQWVDCKLEVQRNWMLEHSGVDFCGTGNWCLLNNAIVPSCFGVTQYITHEEIVTRLPAENILCHGSMMIRRLAIDTLGGYSRDKTWIGREDWELWARAVNAGFSFGQVPERLYIYSLGTSVPR